MAITRSPEVAIAIMLGRTCRVSYGCGPVPIVHHHTEHSPHLRAPPSVSPPFIPGKSSSFYCLHSSALSRSAYGWNLTVCSPPFLTGLLRLGMCVSGFSRAFPGPITPFLPALSAIPLPGAILFLVPGVGGTQFPT